MWCTLPIVKRKVWPVNELPTRQRIASPVLASNPVMDEEEIARLRALDAYEILDSAGEKAYDDVTVLAAFACGTPVALISFFDQDRQWIKASIGAGSLLEKTRTLPRCLPFCDAVIRQPDPVILVPDMGEAPDFCDHSMIFGGMKLRFYAAVPLISPAGAVLGSLSVMDRRSRNLKPEQIRALETLGRQVVELLEVRRTVIGLSEANARLGQQTLTDALTGIANRRAYDQKLTEERSRAKRTGAPLSMLLIDIDHFKQYNDTFGHPAGDTALQSVARVLQASLRPYDFLARYGGEEFVIILPAPDLPDAIIVAERVRGLVAGSEFPHRNFTVSIGVARLNHEADVKALVQAADNGLYRAKAGGRNKVMVGQMMAVMAAD
jgi:diguanylate cyclase (GGDEF)-like protein